MSAVEILERFAQGDVGAFEALFMEFRHEVHGWIVRIVRDRGAAEDLTIETFWRIWRARARFDPGRGFRAWARRIATNVAIDHLNSARPPPQPLDTGRLAAPADGLLRRELLQAIRSAFGTLPPKFRVPVTLALIEGRPYEEIADALGISVGTVKSRVFRGTRRLRRELERLGIKP